MSLPDSGKLGLNPVEQLKLIQLLQLQSWDERSKGQEKKEGTISESTRPLPEKWSLVNNLGLYTWQRQAADRWFENSKRGIVKVVTGAGKTTLALAIAQRLQHAEPNLHVAIVVPTIVLMEQWLDQLSANSNLPATVIGGLGGGASDQFDGTKRVIVCVLNSAAQKLPQMVSQANAGKHLLLVVDECHRAGAAEMRKLFGTPRAYTLGLSATPERDDDVAEPGDSEDYYPQQNFEPVLQTEIGSIVFELNYAEAIAAGILPTFTIEHYALSLSSDEAQRYNAISQEITDLRRQLETRSRRGLALIRWCRSPSGSKDARARHLLNLIVERKQTLYRMNQRLKAVEAIVRDVIANKSDSRIIIFHESIAEVMELFRIFQEAGYRVVAEHSELPDRLRSQAISLFRNGVAQIIVSAKSLIEGFNVPSADVGIIVAASSSVRQRIQTLGRLLRKGANPVSSKQARLIVLFAERTVDELIYEKADWNSFVGAERNEYFRWTDVQASTPERLVSAPRVYVPNDNELSRSLLKVGQDYPGKLDGEIFSVDVNGTVRNANGSPVQITSELRPMLDQFGGGGRLLVTPTQHFVVRLPRASNEGKAIFLGELSSGLKRAIPEEQAELTLEPGAEYPLGLATGKSFSVLQRDERLIAVKERGKVRFVKRLDPINDSEKFARLSDAQTVLRKTYKAGRQINKIFVNDLGHIGYLYQGKAYFVGFAPEGSGGFLFEE